MSDKILKHRTYEIARNHKYDGYENISKYGLNFFDKKTGSEVSENEQLAQELHKPAIKKFKTKQIPCEI